MVKRGRRVKTQKLILLFAKGTPFICSRHLCTAHRRSTPVHVTIRATSLPVVFTSLPVAADGSLYGHATKLGEGGWGGGGGLVRAWRLNQMPKVLLFFFFHPLINCLSGGMLDLWCLVLYKENTKKRNL